MYNKKSGNWYAVPMKVVKTYSYIQELQASIVRRRMKDRESVLRRQEMMPEDPRRIKRTLALTTPPPTAELVRRHRTRLVMRDLDVGPSSEPAQAEARVDSSGAGKAGSNAGDDAAGQDPSRIAP